MPVFFRDLKQEMKRLPKPRNPRNYVRGLKPVKLEVLSSPGLKAVTFRANMEGEEDGPYLTTCKFLNIQNFSDEIEVGYIKTDVSGEEVYAKKPDLSKNPVQIKCSCFVADTKVRMADGSSKKIKDLVGLSEFEVVSYDKNRPVKAKGVTCEIKEKDAEIYAVVLDNNSTIKCTKDHKFLLKDNTWKRADELNENDSLQAMYVHQKVKSVKRLDKKEDVYCFTVPEFGNFVVDTSDNVIDSGVVVKNCDDFRFMFEYPLFRKKGLIGTYRRYTRQTPPPPVGYPFKNPDEYLGFCKHIWNLIGSLKKRNLVKD